jgi:glycosyltransferase involved in cell wall biosynthesis
MASEITQHRLNVSLNKAQGGVTAPRVSVVIAAYNGERFLRPAIESILSQTFSDFELIVIDDCSTDSTPQILSEFKDERLRVIRNECNLGIAVTTNRGIASARSEYIALQDHDDISLPTRLECQVAFLDRNAQVGMVGSDCNIIDEAGTISLGWPVKYDDEELKWALLWRCPFFHTSVMVRRRDIEEVGGYSSEPKYRFSEDYDLMSRIAFRYAVANIPQQLGCWRVHKTSASHRNVSQQAAAVRSISQRNICHLLGWDHIDPVCWEGVERFLNNPVRQKLDLTSAEVIRTLDFLTIVHGAFCSKYGLGNREAAAHRMRVFLPWGKHALALSYRRNGRRDAACRFSLFAGGAKLLLRALLPAP